jgi:hypothetical protein
MRLRHQAQELGFMFSSRRATEHGDGYQLREMVAGKTWEQFPIVFDGVTFDQIEQFLDWLETAAKRHLILAALDELVESGEVEQDGDRYSLRPGQQQGEP